MDFALFSACFQRRILRDFMNVHFVCHVPTQALVLALLHFYPRSVSSLALFGLNDLVFGQLVVAFLPNCLMWRLS